MPAIFLTEQGDLSGAALPSDTAFQYGGSVAIGPPLAFGGARIQLNKQLFSQAAPQNPGATGADNVLAVYSLPANTFDVANRSIRILASGSVANNTNTKTVKIIFNPATAVVGSTVGTGGTTLATTGAYSTTGAAAWLLEGEVYKTGAAGSNTQTAISLTNQIAATTVALAVPAAATAKENGVILIAVTGNAATTATDIGLNLFEVSARC